jgi:aminoglycoside N3'-acetyltransferase
MIKYMGLMMGFVIMFLNSLMIVQNMDGGSKKIINTISKSTTKPMVHMIMLPLPLQKTIKHT